MMKAKLFGCLFAGVMVTSVVSGADVRGGVTHVSQAEFRDKIASGDGSVVIDVRTEEEFLDGHILGAINLPHKDLMGNVSLLDRYRSKDMVFYCRSGVRANYVTEYLNEIDYGDEQSFYHLKGGMRAWRAAQLLIEK